MTLNGFLQLAIYVLVLLSMAVLGAAVVIGLEALALGRGHREPMGREPRLAGIGIGAACFALLATGTLATAALAKQ